VALDEVHPRTLESRHRAGLFLCGEMLDVFGPIGGHNFRVGVADRPDGRTRRWRNGTLTGTRSVTVCGYNGGRTG
jgi:hypothetical protein